MGTSNLSNSGEGSRPTTSAGVDNIGGADTFTPGKTPSASNPAPKPPEKMSEKRQDGISSRAQYPAPHNID